MKTNKVKRFNQPIVDLLLYRDVSFQTIKQLIANQTKYIKYNRYKAILPFKVTFQRKIFTT